MRSRVDPFAFSALAGRRQPPLDRLALSIAGEFRDVDVESSLEALDRMGAELLGRRDSTPEAELDLCRRTLAERHGFAGERDRYHDPASSMLDLVLERRRGLPILLSVVWVEVARRAGILLAGIGLPGHFVVGHFGGVPPLLVDPFAGGQRLRSEPAMALVRPWGPHETALRMLNNLVASYRGRGDIGSAIRTAALRLELPLDERAQAAFRLELRSLESSLN